MKNKLQIDPLEVTGIFVYPVKGLRGISVPEAKCTERGLAHDRLWMVVDETLNFQSQRDFSKMALMKTALTNDGIQISYHGDEIELPYAIASKNTINVTVWDDTCKAIAAESQYNHWISNILGKKCMFVFMPPQSDRLADPKYAQYGEAVSFADGFPYLVLGESTLAYLNDQLESPILMDRFRPNIVFKGGEAHIEDQWGDFSIGQVGFYGAKPCGRCRVTTIDQQTGEAGKEPLKTLSTYRQTNNKILFGMNMLAKNEDVIKVGDSIVLK